MIIRPKMWQIWSDWLSAKKTPKECYQKIRLDKLKRIKKPSEFLNKAEYLILKALKEKTIEGLEERKEKTVIQIERKSLVSDVTIIINSKSMRDKGWITRETRKVNQRNKLFIKITEEGNKLLEEWRKVYN